MKNLTEIVHLDFDMLPDGKYLLKESLYWFSSRYKKAITIVAPFKSDGATGAIDIVSLAWWVHDWLCVHRKFDDDTVCTPLMASLCLYDILKAEGRWIRAPFWFIATYLATRNKW